MAVPIILAVAAHTITKVATSPSTWRLIFTVALIIIGSPFVLKAFFKEARDTVWSLWWVVALIFLLGLARISIPIFIREREETKRMLLRQKQKND